MAEWPEGMEGFARHLTQVRGRSHNTALAYCRDVAAFARWCEAAGRDPLASLTPSACSMYVMSRVGPSKGAEPGAALSLRSAARATSALEAWARYLAFNGEIEPGKAARLKVPKYGRKLPVYFKPEEMLALVRAWEGEDSAVALRNTALLMLLYSSALRVSECSGLRVSDADLSARMLSVTGKGGKQRIVPFGETATAAISAYLAGGRGRLTGAESAEWLWLSTRGRRLGPRAIQLIVIASAQRAGLARHITPHKLRHACATHMLEGGADVRLLQELLGHRDLSTTQVYTQISRQHLLDAYDKTHPRA
jgi:site-specific recombinase XerD